MTFPKFQAGLVLLAASAAAQTPAPHFDLAGGRQFLKTNCAACHGGKPAAGGFDINKLAPPESFRERSELWTKAALRVHNGEMPPQIRGSPGAARGVCRVGAGEPAKRGLCGGYRARPAPARRLSRSQYTATVRDLLNLHVDIGATLPADSAGGEGFDNAAETLFLSPIYAEKYLEAAKLALNYASKDPRARAKFLIAAPGAGSYARGRGAHDSGGVSAEGISPSGGQGRSRFLPGSVLLRGEARRIVRGIDSVRLRAALISPQFLFRTEPPNTTGQTRLLDDYSLASRLSYFLWGSDAGRSAAGAGRDGKAERSGDSAGPGGAHAAESEVRRLRAQLCGPVAADPRLWARPSSRIRSCFPNGRTRNCRATSRISPCCSSGKFWRTIFRFWIFSIPTGPSPRRKLQKVLYGTDIKPARPNNQEQPQRIELPEGSHRGGLLGMSAVLAISSHPHRTSPVLRGKWLLETILGTPPPPPPPNVPKLDETKAGADAGYIAGAAGPAPRQSGMRELSQPHRPARLRAGELTMCWALAHGRRRQADRRQGRVARRDHLRRSRPAQSRSDGARRICSSGISRTRCSGMRWGAG